MQKFLTAVEECWLCRLSQRHVIDVNIYQLLVVATSPEWQTRDFHAYFQGYALTSRRLGTPREVALRLCAGARLSTADVSSFVVEYVVPRARRLAKVRAPRLSSGMPSV